MTLDGRVAIVTGVTKPKGAGKAIAQRLVEQGAAVAITGRAKSLPGAEAIAEGFRSDGHRAIAVAADSTDPDQIGAAVETVVAEFGGMDILVNNAGIGFGSPILADNEDKHWDANWAVNVKGAVAFVVAAWPHLAARGGGSIVNIASLAGIGANSGMPYPYTASKFALVGITKQMALEGGSAGIRANVVCPGAINTDMLQQAYAAIAEAEGVSLEEAAALENSTSPLGRPAEASEIADAVAWLAGPHSSYVTGVALPVAGGMSPGI
ncbi:MAG: SDR family NAD(P)-dependent oxidoreductase [Ilumatobacteraceae bacterium]